jgi:RsiW-degrading membrane proteinase PrsW (M82 family)
MITPDLVPAAMVAAAIAPALLSLWLVVAADSRAEPARLVLIALFLGVASAVAAVAVEASLTHYLPLVANPWLAADEKALLLAAIPEETLKISLIAAIALRARDFDEPMDGVVYGTAVGLGFAALENILYVAGSTHWQGLAIVRGVLSVPLHGAFGAIAGAYIARARFAGVLRSGRDVRWRRRRLFVSAWLVPVILHGAFDASVFSLSAAPDTGEGTAAILLAALVGVTVGFGTIIFAAVLVRRIARRQREWLTTQRLSPGHWRDVWAECLFGLGLAGVGVAMLVAGETGTRLLGALLTAVAIGLAWKGAKRLNDIATSRPRPAAVAAP